MAYIGDVMHAERLSAMEKRFVSMQHRPTCMAMRARNDLRAYP